ncbi:MAG: BMC domain-containing protein [Candidatus Zixiibacteriota bacterium]
MPREALGLIETKGMLGAIEATRAATQAAEVAIASAEQSTSGRVTVRIEGDRASVSTAVEAGALAAERTGQLISMHIIARPDEGIEPLRPYVRFLKKYTNGDIAHTPPNRPAPPKPAPKPKPISAPPKPSPKPKPAPTPTPATISAPTPKPVQAGTVTLDDLEAMPVVKLRQYARTVPGLPIAGRQISMANKTELLEAIKSVLPLS